MAALCVLITRYQNINRIKARHISPCVQSAAAHACKHAHLGLNRNRTRWHHTVWRYAASMQRAGAEALLKSVYSGTLRQLGLHLLEVGECATGGRRNGTRTRTASPTQVQGNTAIASSLCTHVTEAASSESSWFQQSITRAMQSYRRSDSDANVMRAD